ncbi:MAG TPA: metalloregulator ArsR/SmtB family transcription factor [Gemmatimonadales bacterium]|nr:metalloregulator ArsR/SmtB family transcription factor [Gemmatimonadales bacterium]HSC59035.1 metalloregulator ArsR/SmtB family transcription factor [Gemmatimonadales bacterium]
MIELSDGTAGIIADRFRVLAEPMRLRLLNVLRRGELGVGALAERVEAGQANVSKHLQVLYQAGFVDRRKEGTTALYRIADPTVFELCSTICGAVEQDLKRRERTLRRHA